MKLASENSIDSLGLLVADRISAALTYWDCDMVCRFANAAYMVWFGKSQDEIVDKMTMKELIGPVYELNLPYILQAYEGHNQSFEREITLPTGEVRNSFVNYFPDIENGIVKGIFVHVTDITPTKTLEKELVKSNKIILDQNKRLKNFANIITHNLKNYDYGFSGMLKLLENTHSFETQTEIIKHLKTISNSFSETLNNLNEIIHTQNISDIEQVKLNLYSCIIKVLSSIDTQIQESSATIHNHIDPKVLLLGNPAYIESILVNLVTNAIKYKHPHRSPIINISCTTSYCGVELIISDNGLGIDLEKHGQDLFGMYKTFHGNKDARGIGLYITKYQIDTMGGDIKVESEVNKGSKFIVYFK